MSHSLYMDVARRLAKDKSKCQFTQVGAIAVNENDRIIATAVNGTISGESNCCDHHFDTRDDHVPFTRENEIHAEANLLLELARSSVTFSELTLYVTLSPCDECLKLLLGLRTTKGPNRISVPTIVYGERYHRTPLDVLQAMKDKARRAGTNLISIDQAVSHNEGYEDELQS